MNRYTNQQLTSAEVIAELIEMAKEVAAEGNRGKHFIPATVGRRTRLLRRRERERVGGRTTGRGRPRADRA